MPTPRDFADVFDRLERDQARYVVVSGVAVVLHGNDRPTFDLDMVIDRAPDEAQRVMWSLAACGSVPSIPLPLSAVTVLRMFDGLNREVDVFARYHIPFEELWPASEVVRLGDSLVRVASLEHLLKAKRITGRPHDLQDVEGLLAAKKGEGRSRGGEGGEGGQTGGEGN